MAMNTGWSAEQLQTAQTQLSAPAWLQSWRAHQLQEFLQRGFPARREENWKYTPIATLLEHPFAFGKAADAADNSTLSDITAFKLEGCYQIVFIDGVFSADQSTLHDLPEKILLTSLRMALQNQPQLLQAVMEPANSSGLSVFHWLNGALCEDGLLLIVPDDIVLSRPVHLLYLTTDTRAEHTHNPRHFIQLGANSSALVLEEYRGLGTSRYFNNVVTNISVGRNAQLNYYKLQCEAATGFHVANTEVRQYQDSRVSAGHFAAGGRLNREDLHFWLQEGGADCQLAGFYYPKAQQHIDFHTRIDHHHAHTHSRQHYKGIVAEHGHGVFNGKIIVHPQAQQITAEQSNHNLLLGESATIDTKPELEVFADNVRCSHGATIGHLDVNALFYLQSRGIEETVARELLMSAFAQEIFDRLSNPQLTEYLRSFI
jgi:Fe-S cluster assembly protein SufD